MDAESRGVGAVWLPLPHLLNAAAVQVDAWYRNGGSAVAISIVGFDRFVLGDTSA